MATLKKAKKKVIAKSTPIEYNFWNIIIQTFLTGKTLEAIESDLIEKLEALTYRDLYGDKDNLSVGVEIGNGNVMIEVGAGPSKLVGLEINFGFQYKGAEYCCGAGELGEIGGINPKTLDVPSTLLTSFNAAITRVTKMMVLDVLNKNKIGQVYFHDTVKSADNYRQLKDLADIVSTFRNPNSGNTLHMYSITRDNLK